MSRKLGLLLICLTGLAGATLLNGCSSTADSSDAAQVQRLPLDSHQDFGGWRNGSYTLLHPEASADH